jgi:hypothetical protein
MAFAALPTDCHSLVQLFIKSSQKVENLQQLKNNWSARDKKLFLDHVRAVGFDDQSVKVMVDSLNMQRVPSTFSNVKKYIDYVFTLSEKDQKIALLDLAQLDAQEVNSKHVKNFMAHEAKLNEKFLAKKMDASAQKRYQDLYYGCKALRPNDINKNAAKNFKRFNLSLSLGTLGASYAFYNMDKELDGEWYAKLGYDVGVTILMSYVGGNIQTKATDTQLAKSLKGYFMGRALSVVDIVVYDPIFNKEHATAEHRFEELKKDPEFKKKAAELFKLYQQQGLYRKYKNNLMDTLRKLPEGISLGVKGPSVDEYNVDWNNLTHADLERPEVQDVLVAASMAQVYQEGKGQWIETGDNGLDRYAFNTIFYGVQIPKSIVQNFLTYKMLCMGQDNVKLSFTNAVIFNVATNFFVNQALYGYREKAINQ